ncbi:MAG: alginate lyase family protein [Bacteroidales bacterium]|nr:alginate lyase family protein [Bacteroidales bacterium]
MRPAFHIKAIAAFAAVALFSCQGYEDTLVSGSMETVRLTVSSDMPDWDDGLDPDSKTFWNGETIFWSPGDKIALCLTENEVWHGTMYVSDALTEGAAQADFVFSLPASLEGSLQFRSIYPSSAVKSAMDDAPEVVVEIPSVQTPAADSFDPAADIMVGKTMEPYPGVPEESVLLYWTRLVAHADITLKSLPTGDSETVESVVLKCGDGTSLAGTFSLDVDSQTMSASDGAVSSEILIDAGALALTETGDLRVWASVAPCTLTSLEVTVTTDRAVYVREIPSCSISLRRNTRNVFAVDMSSAVEDMLPAEKEKLNALVNSRVFTLLDLELQGLETVKRLYEAGEPYKAAVALKDYWKTSRTIVNPAVDLTQTSYSDVDKNRADQALKENGYRFYVKNYAENGKDTDADAQYYSFSDGAGGINWNFSLADETQFDIQKHRHQWVLPQAKVYWGTKDETYARSYVEVYSSWLAAYPCPGAATGDYRLSSSDPVYDMWTDLQASSRVMDQISVLDYYISSDGFTPEFLTHFLAAFADAVECIRANPYAEQLSNHRLYEIQAVFTAAVMMPEFKAASDWLSESSMQVESQLHAQFAADGVLVEMDPGYHIPVVSIFYEMNKVASANGMLDAFPSDYTTCLAGAVKFIRDLAYPDYSLEDFNDVRSSSWNKSTLTKNFKKYAEMFPDDQTLLYWATDFSSGAAPAELLSTYATTGWYMLRNGWTKNSTMLILKNNYNEKSDGGVWWHCQPDNGTVSLYHNGRRFLPDAGAYTYTEGTEREAFRATAMHNTLTRNLETIADGRMKGAYVSSSVSDDCLMLHVKNQAYDNTRHERVVFMVDGRYYVIVDSALGSATGTSIELSWHLCPGDIAFDAYGANAYGCHTSFTDGNNMMFKTFCFAGEKGRVPAEDFIPSNGMSYTSSAINGKEPRKFYRTAVKIGSENTPVRFITVIYPVSDYSSAPEVSASFGSSLSEVVIAIDGESRTLTY